MNYNYAETKSQVTIGKFLEQGIKNGKIAENQPVVYYNKNNNIEWVGKAGYAPVYLDWVTLNNYETVNNELRINERVA